MRPAARLAILIAVVLALVLTLAACAPGDPVESPGYVSGDGTVTVFDEGAEVALAGTSFAGDAVDVAEYRGQVVLINTWYASCPPCRAEAPDLAEIDARDDVQIVGVNGRDDAATAEAFERTFGIAYPSIDDSDGAATAALQGIVAMNAVPTTLVIDTEGRLHARVIGTVDPSTLRTLVDEAAGAAA
ncbi:TlpA family protein disulfide reductase [Demequina mangrovi]|uniref:Thiol-disulfide isomerase or thioredoxin n=1 Tax=Demequina mangrovi TaxID=1043493 RepID=A0A1H6W8H6_9MICO|nr:TlpA disulfide reductase family protein [Demequina mangrovi]SEJ13213.1 Thiol-disulfide isomerase or thioredoxin [Demequina mangrovi]